MNFIKKTHHQQEDNTACVPAALAMVLSVYGKEISQSELREYIGVTPGGTQIEVTWSRVPFEKWGLECDIKFGATLEDMKNSLEAGAPVIAIILSLYLPHSTEDYLHALVLIGMDEKYLYINDPLTDGQQTVRMAYDTFLEAWEWYNRCAIIIQPLPKET
jgi:uncharacterized protein YvpB